MRASERLAERNDILAVINQIDDDLDTADADLTRELLDIRRGLGRELSTLGFTAPDLDERFKEHEGTVAGAVDSAGGGGGSVDSSVVAKRRIGPPGEVASG
ncbi:hypothetical protein CG716_04945 [Mycolicibacterium sphagni]|uniref:Uncharacterized protein n=1 Tax=Mycolicibacterium sphagni TaxID=1786 RepID=A0A255DQS5_9MYCO|nr:hypothetical protein CG716_04945 [Mycolicibacterium sphagni]